jgi:alpha-galactosidase
MKIVFVGGGSVQWTPKLVTDLALTETLADAHLVLHDIDSEALDLLARVCKRIVTQAGARVRVSATLDRIEALRGADFVILCVAIGGLAAMRNDLEIPERYGIDQSVGDTVGPGGLARGLRHIPFAVQVAREMEQLCPKAWLMNLTNPMTTICRATCRATSISTVGLCHEVTGVRRRLEEVLDIPEESIDLDVAGVNHLPVILNLRVGAADGTTMLRDWLAERGPSRLIDEHISGIRDIFHDRMAVKLTLFQHLGVLFGAGDRHVAEFFPGFLTKTSARGCRYGVVLTTIAHRETLAQQRRAGLEDFINGAPRELKMSDEQLAPVMAALAGGPPGEFVVDVPNKGQIDNLPREAVVECKAQVNSLGIHPLATGPLPYAAYAVISGHVARQELIVEAALTGQRGPALAALATDPLVHDPAIVEPMLDELMAANQAFL